MPWLRVVAIDPPGRGGRSDDIRGTSDIQDLEEIRAVAEAITKHSATAKHIAMCGLSMGCLTALEVFQALDAKTQKKLCFLGLAGRAPIEAQATVIDDAFDLDALNLAPDSVRNSDIWEEHFKPLLLSDLRADTRAANRLASSVLDLEVCFMLC